MVKFSFKGRQYSASESQGILTLTNQDSVQLIVTEGQEKALKKDQQGNVEEVDLHHLQYKNFYSGLIKEAKTVIEEELRDKAKSFFKEVEVHYEEKVQDFHQTLNIAVIGNVSSGKSSLINALLMRERHNAIAKVGVTAGVTTNLNILRLDGRVRLIDSPGLGDIREENSKVTQGFLKS